MLADDLSTWANENGYRPDAIERQLAHVESNKVRATYNKALLLDQRRTLLQDWADYLSAAGRQRHGIGTIWPGVAERIGRGGLFPFWIGPLSLECRSLAICLCPRLGLEMG